MRNIIVTIACVIVAALQVSEAAYTSEMALCADICPSSPLVSANGAGMNKCYEACKRLIHRVKFGDVLESTSGSEKVKAPKPSRLSRIRKGLGKVLHGTGGSNLETA
ncbi:hypothetical protein X943_000357 [Babesia divergens]|uniref:Uncharacterized protein n=1 Tax=Babesia divergens TaxID=32595 RepID=A0AAD9LGG9_BABDI|nr:hypothetical protein X943_000357 [Babesia divergens]